jgi:uncharacterized OsmC-like protein
MQNPTMLNGMNVSQLQDTIGAIQQQPELAKFQFRATNQWLSGNHNRTHIKDFYGAGQEDTSRAKAFVLDVDEPSVLQGDDHGPSPAEYVLNALAGCLTTTLVFQAALQGIHIEEMESTIEGDVDLRGGLGINAAVRAGYENITVTFRVKSAASAAQLQALTRFSPVLDIVSNPVPVNVRVIKTGNLLKEGNHVTL